MIFGLTLALLLLSLVSGAPSYTQQSTGYAQSAPVDSYGSASGAASAGTDTSYSSNANVDSSDLEVKSNVGYGTAGDAADGAVIDSSQSGDLSQVTDEIVSEADSQTMDSSASSGGSYIAPPDGLGENNGAIEGADLAGNVEPSGYSAADGGAGAVGMGTEEKTDDSSTDSTSCATTSTDAIPYGGNVDQAVVETLGDCIRACQDLEGGACASAVWFPPRQECLFYDFRINDSEESKLRSTPNENPGDPESPVYIEISDDPSCAVGGGSDDKATGDDAETSAVQTGDSYNQGSNDKVTGDVIDTSSVQNGDGDNQGDIEISSESEAPGDLPEETTTDSAPQPMPENKDSSQTGVPSKPAAPYGSSARTVSQNKAPSNVAASHTKPKTPSASSSSGSGSTKKSGGSTSFNIGNIKVSYGGGSQGIIITNYKQSPKGTSYKISDSNGNLIFQLPESSDGGGSSKKSSVSTKATKSESKNVSGKSSARNKGSTTMSSSHSGKSSSGDKTTKSGGDVSGKSSSGDKTIKSGGDGSEKSKGSSGQTTKTNIHSSYQPPSASSRSKSSTTSDCQDKDYYCAKFLANDQCKLNTEWMKYNCAKTCNAC